MGVSADSPGRTGSDTLECSVELGCRQSPHRYGGSFARRIKQHSGKQDSRRPDAPARFKLRAVSVEDGLLRSRFVILVERFHYLGVSLDG
jgi:hypothetical protein